MTEIIMLAIGITATIVMYKWNSGRKLRAYVKYYKNKRREFPWLVNWIKENKIDPATERVKDEKSGTRWLIGIYFAFIAILLLFLTWSIPPQIIFVIILPLAVSFFSGREKIKNPDDYERGSGDGNEWEPGLTLECPSCHCPHSWVMTQKDTIVESDSTTTKITTTTRETTGGGLVGLSESIMNDGTTSTKKSKTTFQGREIRYFKCLNCGHTSKRKEETRSWNSSPVSAEEINKLRKERRNNGVNEYEYPCIYVRSFDPPMPAWEHETVKQNVKNQYEQELETADGNSELTETMIKAAESRNDDARFVVGISYLLGMGVEKDYKKAKSILKRKEDEDYDVEDYSDLLPSGGSIDYMLMSNIAFKAKYLGFFPFAVSIYKKIIEDFPDKTDGSCYQIGLIYACQLVAANKDKAVKAKEKAMYDNEKARYWLQKAENSGGKVGKLAKKALKKLK